MGASPTPPSAEPAIAVAVSGGRDSTALLHATARAACGMGLSVHALHVHHGLSPQADTWASQVQAQCRRWGVRFHVARLSGAPAAAESVEAWARRERYAALARMAHAAGCDAVLLAHHRRDQAETVLLQALRGGGARGLAAMPVSALRDGITWLRPWRDHPREAVEAYVRRHRLRFVDDGSNADPRFARNRLRLTLWPALLGSFPEAEAALAHAAARAAEEAACLADLAVADAEAATDGLALLRTPWLQLPVPRRGLLLRHQLARWCGRGAPETLVQRLQSELPAAASGRWPAPGGELRLYRGRLTYTPGSCPLSLRDTVLDLGQAGRYPVPDADGAWRVEEVREGGIGIERLRAVIVGLRREGDRFQVHPGAPVRSLKKQFQAAGVPAWARTGPVLRALDGQLIYVIGLGPDARAIAAPGAPQFGVSWVPAGLV